MLDIDINELLEAVHRVKWPISISNQVGSVSPPDKSILG